MKHTSDSFFESIIVPSRMVFFMWLLFFLETKFKIDLGFLGVYPRTLYGLAGIAGMPLVHASVFHIASNTIPILILGSALYFFYPKIANKVFIQCYFFTSALVWIFAKPANHIGASGVVYGLAAFLILYGWFKKDMKSTFISAAVLIIYGGIFLKMIPANPWVSWEAHLLGAVVGAVNAFILSRNR